MISESMLADGHGLNTDFSGQFYLSIMAAFLIYHNTDD